MKRLFSFLICAVFIFSLAVPVSASLQYTYIDTIYSSLTFDDFWGIATCSGTVESIDDNELEIEVTFQISGDNGWEDLITWRNTGKNGVDAGGRYAVARGEQYRLYVTAYVYDDNGRIVESGSQTQTKYF